MSKQKFKKNLCIYTISRLKIASKIFCFATCLLLISITQIKCSSLVYARPCSLRLFVSHYFYQFYVTGLHPMSLAYIKYLLTLKHNIYLYFLKYFDKNFAKRFFGSRGFDLLLTRSCAQTSIK